MPSHAMNIINLKKGGSPEPPEPPPAYALAQLIYFSSVYAHMVNKMANVVPTLVSL